MQFKEQSVVNDKATIDFLVNTGERHRLVSIQISGNQYFTTPTIRERMFLLTASFLQYRRGRYSGALLRRDEESIRNLYSSNGFRDVIVTHRLTDDYRGKVGDLAVFIDIAEGSQYFVHDLVIEGIEKLDRDRIIAMLSSARGQPFSEFNVAVDRDAILNEYFTMGFPDVSFEWDSEPAAEPHQVDLRFVIKEGRQQFVRAVLISGNKVTRSRLVNRQITFGPGDPLSPTEMTDIQRRLYLLGVFAKVNTAIQNPDGATSRKLVLYNMEEARRYSTAIGFGASFGRFGGCRENCYSAPVGSTGFSPRVSFDISRYNLWGLAHSISLRTRLSTLNRTSAAQLRLAEFQEPGLPFIGNLHHLSVLKRYSDIHLHAPGGIRSRALAAGRRAKFTSLGRGEEIAIRHRVPEQVGEAAGDRVVVRAGVKEELRRLEHRLDDHTRAFEKLSGGLSLRRRRRRRNVSIPRL